MAGLSNGVKVVLAMSNRTPNRVRDVLQAIITQYIVSGEPVGSSILAQKYISDLSPATIRNIMSAMEDMGYLSKPHTSAGRVPTDMGFRFYIDSILEVKELSKAEREKIKEKYREASEIDAVMQDTSNILSSLSNCMGLVLAPRFDNIFIKHIEFVRLSRTQIMVLIVSTSGIVQNRIVRIDEELKQHELEKMTGYLNEIVKGLTLRMLKHKIIEEMEEEKNLYDQLLKKALVLSRIALDNTKQTDNIYIEGKTNILEQPEFVYDLEQMKLLFKAFEEKSVLLNILDKAMNVLGIQVSIGSENGVGDIQGCSIITAPYSSNGNILGTLGVVGPVRMNYAKIIPLVSYTANLLGEIITQREAI